MSYNKNVNKLKKSQNETINKIKISRIKYHTMLSPVLHF